MPYRVLGRGDDAYHPLWAPPTKTDIAAARAYVASGLNAATANERERGFFDAVDVLFGDGDLATFLPVPAHELAGRLALADGQFAAAAEAFRTSLALYPRRPIALYGLATALYRTGNAAEAHSYAQQFLEMWSHADAGRPEVSLAKTIALGR